MANDILIVPGSSKIEFSGSQANTIQLETQTSGSVVFTGASGSLFGISDNFSGSLMSVSDVSGIPILEVFDDDRVVMGKYSSPAATVTGSKIGIGTASPGNPLHVYHATTNGVALFESGDAQGGIALADNSTSNKVFLLATGDDFGIQTGGVANRLTVKSDGKVGIGDTTPDAILDVDNSASTGTTVMHLTDSGGTGAHTMLQMNNTGGSVGQFNISGNDLYINATSDIILQSSGDNIGIGLTAPTSPLHIRNGKSSSVPNLLVDDSTGLNAILEVTSLNASADAFITIGSQTNRDTSLRFNENGSVSFQIKNLRYIFVKKVSYQCTK